MPKAASSVLFARRWAGRTASFAACPCGVRYSGATLAGWIERLAAAVTRNRWPLLVRLKFDLGKGLLESVLLNAHLSPALQVQDECGGG